MKRLALFAAILLLSVPAYADTKYVTADLLNIRSKPGTDSEVIDTVTYGTALYLSDDDPDVMRAGWYRVKVNEHVDGYVSGQYVSDESPTVGMELLGTWRVTAYAWTGFPCANGSYPTEGHTIACNSLPFGSKVYIEGVGIRTVEDRGPASIGNEWLDLYLGVTADCVQWGSQMRQVFLVGSE